MTSSEPKYASYSVTMETKDDIYEFKQDTPPPMPLSASRVPSLSAACSTSELCDSQTEPMQMKKDCDSSTSDKPEDLSGGGKAYDLTTLAEEKMDIGVPQSSSQAPQSSSEAPPPPAVIEGVAATSEAYSACDDEVQKKRRKEDAPPGPQSVVSSTSKSGAGAGNDGGSPKPAAEESGISNAKPVNMEVCADTTEKPAAEMPSVSSSVSPPLTSSAPGSGSSSPKVPPLKIVIPQTSEPDCKDRNKTNSARQALPYVVNSNAVAETTESSILYSSASGSQPTDSVRVTYSKLLEPLSSNGSDAVSTPERASQRVTRSTHRMQAALANVNPTNSDTNVDNYRSSGDVPEELPPQVIGLLPRKRKLRSRDPSVSMNNSNSESNHSSASSTSSHDDQPTVNCYHMYLDIRRQVRYCASFSSLTASTMNNLAYSGVSCRKMNESYRSPS